MPLSETILVIMGLSTMAMIAASVCRNLPVPYTVFLVIIGMGLSGAADYVPALELLDDFRLTPDLVFFIFLPALIFESALNLDARQLIKDIAPILALAIPALLISTAIIGFGAHYVLGIELTVALLFGALIAATDPVAVVALFKELGAPPRLTVLVEGESLLNDATAIVIFNILLGIALAGGTQGIAPWQAVGEFLTVFAGGVAVGALIGFGIAELMRRLHSSELALLVMSLVMAYASFVIAEHVMHVSGVMAAVSAAVAMGLYAITRIPQSATHMIHQTWEVIGLICNSLLFLMMGLSVDLSLLIDGLDMILVGALLVLLARAISVYSLVPVTTRLFAVPEIKMGERHIMWWGGLKGGLAIAIVLSIPEDLPGRQMLVSLTLGVVLFTLLINAPTIRPLIKLLGIDRLTEDEQAEYKRGLLDARARATSVLSRLESADLIESDRVADLESELQQTFTADIAAPSDHRQLRHTYLEALRIEYLALEEMYRIDLIHEYTYLDMRAMLRRDRDAWLALPNDCSRPPAQSGANPFVRLERASLAWMREQNWLAGALARYQRLRITQSLQRDVAGILTTTAVIEKLATRPGLPAEDIDAVLAVYRQRLARKCDRLAAIRLDFPDYYARFEQRMFQTAALRSALHASESKHLHGDLGGKAYARVKRHIEAALAELPPLLKPTRTLQASELIDRVPLFKGLPRATLDRLADQAQPVSFLPGDVIIEAQAKGNALYIITLGAVGVYRNGQSTDDGPIARLGAGDFFGETALLGDDVRTATVKALTPASLLRLTRRTVLDLAARDPEIEARLKATRTRRVEKSAESD